MIRYSYVIPGASVREEIRGETKAESEQALRALLRAEFGHESAVNAIVTAVEPQSSERKE